MKTSVDVANTTWSDKNGNLKVYIACLFSWLCIFLLLSALTICDGKRQLPSYLLLTLSTHAAKFCRRCFFHTYNFFCSYVMVCFSHRLKRKNEKNVFLNVLLNVCRLYNIQSFMKKCYLSHNVIIMFFELLFYYIIVTHIIKINQISLSHLFFRNLFQKAFPVSKIIFI